MKQREINNKREIEIVKHDRKKEKRAYSEPKLLALGDMKKITLGGSMDPGDSGGGYVTCDWC